MHFKYSTRKSFKSLFETRAETHENDCNDFVIVSLSYSELICFSRTFLEKYFSVQRRIQRFFGHIVTCKTSDLREAVTHTVTVTVTPY